MTAATRVDVNVPRFNQLMVAILVGAAFVAQFPLLVGLTAFTLAATRFGGPRWGVFTQFYLRGIRPRLAGPVETEPAAPPRFAQGLGVVFLTAASGLFVVGLATAGWVVSLGVFALALLAATTRICVGCLVYERAVG